MANATVFYEGPLVTREEAKRQGLAFYYSGIPCPKAHVDLRYTASNRCRACRLASKRAEYHRNRHCYAKRMASYRKLNAVALTEQRAGFRKINRERLMAGQRLYYAANRDKCVAACRAYYESHTESARQRRMEWEKRNPELVRLGKKAYKHRRRAKQALGGSFIARDVQEILQLQKHKCAICRKKLGRTHHVDHIIPLAKGGTNDRRNIQIAHPRCNTQKAAKDPIDFMRSRGFLL